MTSFISKCAQKKAIIGFLLILISWSSVAQTDTVKTKKNHSPKTAAIMSACLPGLGQIYNRKYWKLPIIYGGAATLIYFGVENSKYYHKYFNAYKLRTDGDPLTIDEYDGKYTDASLLELKNYYRRNLELTVIFSAALYALNIIDANVDAHLYKFDINDNLSLTGKAGLIPSGNIFTPGITLSFNFGTSTKKAKN